VHATSAKMKKPLSVDEFFGFLAIMMRCADDPRERSELCKVAVSGIDDDDDDDDDDVMGYTKKTEVIKKFLNRKREKAKQV